MQTIESPSVAHETQPNRRQLRRVVERRAAADAAAALHAAALRAREDRVLATADAMFGDRVTDEATRDVLLAAIESPQFQPQLRQWIRQLREVASTRPETGACTIATALLLVSWTLKNSNDPQTADELIDVLNPLLAARCLAIEVAGAAPAGVSAEAALRAALSQTYAGRTAAAAGAACAEIVFGERRHLAWDAEGCATCFNADDVDALEAFMPGIASGARTSIDVIESDGTHPAKAGPCVRYDGVETFLKLRNRLDGCLTGIRVAKSRAAALIELLAEGRS